MSPTTWDLLLGPLGFLVGTLTALVTVLTTQIVVPGSYYRESEARNKLLEAENEKLHETFVQLLESVAGYREQLGAATAEREGLREQLVRIEKDLVILRAEKRE